MKISIAIPCYEMGDKGGDFLDFSLSKIFDQTYKQIEVIVSDHSIDDNVKDVCEKWKKLLDIKYLRNEIMRGSSSQNINNCIKNSSGELIKILCQDDYLYDKDSINNTVRAFIDDNTKHWLVSNYLYTDDNKNFKEYRPYLNANILLINTIGTHSCLTIRNKDLIYFDENLIWFMDCEYYNRLLKTFDKPIFLPVFTVAQFIWSGQVTNTLANEEVRQKEKQYIERKYYEHRRSI